MWTVSLLRTVHIRFNFIEGQKGNDMCEMKEDQLI